LVAVERVIVEDLDVQFPLFEIVGRHEADAWGKVFLDLCNRVKQGYVSEQRTSVLVK